MGTTVKLSKDENGVKVDPALYRSMIEKEKMVKTRGASSKKIPASQSKKVPSPSPPPSVSTAPPSIPAPATSVGKTSKSKARKKVFSLSTEHPMVFPDITAYIVDVAPPSEVVVPSRAKNLSLLPIESCCCWVTQAAHEASQSKKNSVAPKRKLELDSSSSPLTAAKKRLKAHPPSPSSSEADPEEVKYESEATHDTILSDESVPDNVELEAESDEPEQEDIVPSEQEDESNKEPVATPLSSKAKGKRPISNSSPSPKLSGVNFKPYSSTFCYNDNARDMVLYAQRKFIIERNYVLSDHRPYGVLTMLQDRKWTSSLVKFTVFVRGHWSSFSPHDIAHALHLPLDVEDDDDLASLDKDAVITELVGQKMVWPSNTVISVTNLTYTYAVLHKFATTNWKPTSHTATISFDMASFLYKVGTGIGINLAMFIYDQIIGFRKGNRRDLNLPFPQVIYKVLSMQKKDLQRDQEDLVAPTTAASYKASAPTTEATNAPSTKKVKSQSLKFSSDDIPHASSFVPTDSRLVATELAVVRASVDSLAARVMSIEGLQRSVLDVVQTLSKDPIV
ncbi:uncharacterized protein LOC133806103 [Humulus lupulus]|uniref:uncharacterized protein LOC133806103 n=1 Tax=Humulus lupulus TaxID=3486 RepID=UPI002B402A5C|nr:uncharacterized protein LOC133806103 [Humulus lupulus]